MTSRGLVRFIVGMMLLAVIPYVVVSVGEEGTRGSVWVLCLLIAWWSGWHLTTLIARAEPRLYEFIFWLFCYIFMGIAPAVQLRTNEMPNTTPFVSPSGDLVAGLIVVLGIVGYEIGVLSERLGRNRLKEPSDIGWVGDVPTLEQPFEPERTPMLTRLLPLLAMSTLASLYIVGKAGIGAFFGSRELRARMTSGLFGDPTVAAIFANVSWIPALVVVHRVISALQRPDGTRARMRMSERLVVFVAGVLILISDNPLSSARYLFGAMAFSLVVLFGAFRTSQRTRWTMIGILVSLFVLFPLANTFRRESGTVGTVTSANEYQGNGDYDAFAQIHNSITIVEHRGYTYLQQPLGVALFWVPRSVWPNKPEDTGIFIAKERGYSFTNLSAPPWAELYLIGGAAPVLLGFIAIGKWLRRSDRAVLQRFVDRRPLTVVDAFMPFYLMILLRGSLLQATALLALFAASVRFTRPRRRSSADDEQPPKTPGSLRGTARSATARITF